MIAHAADTTLTLACQGTTTSGIEDAKPEPVSMGIIVNFTKKTVHGFDNPGMTDFPVNITAVNEVSIAFGGSMSLGSIIETNIMGSIDRVTGDVEATSRSSNTKTGKLVTSTSYLLKCRPTQRMF
jgi:hypothetical protein